MSYSMNSIEPIRINEVGVVVVRFIGHEHALSAVDMALDLAIGRQFKVMYMDTFEQQGDPLAQMGYVCIEVRQESKPIVEVFDDFVVRAIAKNARASVNDVLSILEKHAARGVK